MKIVTYHVAPRYSGGSPAMVDYDTAARVAMEEMRAYAEALEGSRAERERERAERLGIAGIVESRLESAQGWNVGDLLTGETSFRPFKESTHA